MHNHLFVVVVVSLLTKRNNCTYLPIYIYIYVCIYIYITFLNLNSQNKFRERSTLGGAVIIMINGSKISVHRFIATTLCSVKA